jgi:hypothetical protein
MSFCDVDTAVTETKHDKLLRILRELYNNDIIFDLVLKESGVVRTAERIALALWVRQIPEDENTAELRRQLIHLWEDGQWDF